MKLLAYCTILPLIFLASCKPKAETVGEPNLIKSIQFEPFEHEEKPGRVKMTIQIELSRFNPIYPTGIKNKNKAEKLQLTLDRTEVGDEFFIGEYSFEPLEDEEITLHMEDFYWGPTFINFNPIELPLKNEIENQSEQDNPITRP